MKRLSFGQVNERQRKERDGEDTRGIQIKVSKEKMEGSRCHIYLKGREQESGMKTRRGCKEEKENQKEGGERHKRLRRGRGINGLFELCKIAAWERVVCLCVLLV